MNIIILDDYQDAVRKLKCAAKLESLQAKVFTNNVKGIGQLSVRLRDAEVLVLIRERTAFPKQLLEKLPKLKLIAQTGKVGAHIDIEACTKLGIAVAEGVGDPTAPAELTWALIMAAMRRVPQYISHLKHGGWQQSGLKAAAMPGNFALGMRLSGKTLGIWGYGRIGQRVAGFGRAFGMKVVVWGREASRQKAVADGYEAAASREAFFEHSDVLSLHLRLVPETRGIVTLDDLVRMKPTALFVNTSRAELVGDSALVSALNRSRPGMAAVDVFESEPILQGHPLLRLENCVCTPHIGYVELDTYEQYFGAAFDNVAAFVRQQPTNIVNPEALKGDAIAIPGSPGEVFVAFTSLALQGFGGVLPVAQRELVDKRGWMTREEFAEALSIGQVLPGPNIVNMALMFGDRFFGWRGAAAALGGILLAPLAIVLALAVLYAQIATHPVAAGAVRGMGAVAAGLVFATALKLAPTLKKNPLPLPLLAAAVLATWALVGVLRLAIVGPVLGLGGTLVAFALFWLRRAR